MKLALVLLLLVQLPTSVGGLRALGGRVELHRGAETLIADRSVELLPGDRLATATASFAVADLDGGAQLQLGADTEVEFRGGGWSLHRGTLRISTPGGPVYVETPHGSFTAGDDPVDLSVALAAGHVEATILRGTMRMTIAAERLVLRGAQTLTSRIYTAGAIDTAPTGSALPPIYIYPQVVPQIIR